MYVDKFATLAGSKLDGSFSESEQRVVSTLANVFAGVNTSATLAHDDRASVDGLAIESLHAKALALGIASVAG
jgi:hypothetical protein